MSLLVVLFTLRVAGENVLALHTLNTNATRSDLVIEAQPTAMVDDVAPFIASITPPASPVVQALSSVEVLFSEPVQGVDASDLLINNVPATGLIFGIPGQFVFSFPATATGAVTVAFASGHGITDLALTPNVFAGALWTYTVDPNSIPSAFIISEFMAANSRTLNDEYGQQSDWIEIHNSGPNPGNLEGWFLTDDTNNLTKWRFPARNMDPGAYLVVFASGRNQTNGTGNLHTSFQLKSSGEYLALVDPATNVVSEFHPTYPPQSDDVSYGRDRLNPNITGHFSTPTPRAANSSSGAGFVPEVQFSRNSRTFPTNQPFTLTLTTSLPEAAIYYSFGTNFPSSNSVTSFRYTGPITVSNTLAIRARAFATGLLPSAPVSKTFIGLANHTNVLNFNSDLPIVVLHNFGQGPVPADNNAERHVFLQTFESDCERSSMTNEPTLTARGVFHVRGSSTLTYPKSSFFLETRDEFGANLNVPLLGMPPESDWVLYAPNNFEPALMHNPLAMQLARDGGEYAPRTRFFELYLKDDAGTPGPISSTGFTGTNGDYHGIYVLMEKIKRDKNRVDIEKLEPEHIAQPEVSGGYLVSIDRSDDGTLPVSAGGAWMNWLEPNYRTMTNANRAPQRAYFISYFDAFNAGLTGASLTNVVNNTNHHSNYIDINSWVRRHVHETVTFNIDALRLSGYLYKDRNKKIEYGPAWDYDRTQGSTDGRGFNPRIWANGTDYFNFTNWWGTLFRAPDFFQAWLDRYQQERLPGGSLSTNNIYGHIDEFYHQLKEAQPREQARWGVVVRGTNGSGSGTYLTEIQWKRNWYASRLNFMDTNFLAQPFISSAGGMVASGFQVMLTPGPKANSSVIYTLDGTDPRLPNGFISPGALSNNRPVVLTVNSNMRIVARSWNPTHRNLTGAGNPPINSIWSGPMAASFYTALPPLRITEIMYHPANPPTGNTNDADNFEYLEVRNTGAMPLNVNRFRLRGGLDFDFPDAVLASGEYAVIVKDLAAFQSRYGAVPRVLGVYTNDSLANDSDRLILEGRLREPILDFTYKDDWYPSTDGAGFSLVIQNDALPPSTWSLRTSWRAGGMVQGTPGVADPGDPGIAGVVINEALTRTDPLSGDAIEIYNPTGSPVDVSHWYLTDDFDAPKQYRIPVGPAIPADGYRVFYQSNSFGVGATGFALGAKGDQVYLYSANEDGNLTGYMHGFDFGAQANGATFGRHLISNGDDHFVTQITPTLGSANSGPKVGPIVISEIHYHPPDLRVSRGFIDNCIDEYIELHNLSGAPVSLFDPAAPTNTWRLRDAVDFEFPRGVSIPAGGFLLVVPINPNDPGPAAAFRARNNVPSAVPMFGPFRGQLDNSRDAVELERPDNPEANDVPYILIERVKYEDQDSWPLGADGYGASLQRVGTTSYANDPANWVAASKTPGAPGGRGDAPTITAQPADTAVLESLTASLSVTASGPGPLAYQWRLDANPIPGANSAMLVLNAVRRDQAGVYSCLVLNPSGTALSSNATLTVPIPAELLFQPVTTRVRISPDPLAAPTTNATFSVAASSVTPIRYQWRFNGTNIIGQTNPSLTITNVQMRDEGLYGVAITDDIGTIFTTNASLVPLVTPVIIQKPSDVTVAARSDFSLSVAVTGNPMPFAYSWRRSLSPLVSVVVNTNSGNYKTNFITLNSVTASLGLVNNIQSSNFQMRLVVYNDANLSPGVTTTFNVTVLEDSDRDGIPNEFELGLGLDLNNAADAAGDLDQDGMSNRAEFIAGTDPANPLSCLKIESATTPGTFAVQFAGMSNHTYTVQFTDGLKSGTWSKLADFAARSTNFTLLIPDPTATTNRFYRVATPRQQ